MPDQAQGLRVLADQVRADRTSGTASQARARIAVSRDAARSAPCGAMPGAKPAGAREDRNAKPDRSRAESTTRARIIAVTSGKGGVGKSNLSTNLSITMGRRGSRVILLDADVGLANAHILLGAAPRFTLEDVLSGTKTVAEVLHSAAENVRLIGGGSGITALSESAYAVRRALLSGLRELDSKCDVVVIDTGAGVAENVLAFLTSVDEVIVVTTPEPTAVANAYATVKVVSQENPRARLMLVVNMVHSSGEGAMVAERLSAITRQFLDRDVDYLGCIPIDSAVPKAVRLRTPFVSAAPGCAASGGINHIISRLAIRSDHAPANGGLDGFVRRLQRRVRGRVRPDACAAGGSAVSFATEQ
jgi:flagellar biosynthesis protein FlhG